MHTNAYLSLLHSTQRSNAIGYEYACRVCSSTWVLGYEYGMSLSPKLLLCVGSTSGVPCRVMFPLPAGQTRSPSATRWESMCTSPLPRRSRDGGSPRSPSATSPTTAWMRRNPRMRYRNKRHQAAQYRRGFYSLDPSSSYYTAILFVCSHRYAVTLPMMASEAPI